jgi:hypothetical protein
MIFELYGIVKDRKKKVIAIGNNGRFSTENPGVIATLENMGFKEITETVVEPELSPKPKEKKNDNHIKPNKKHTANKRHKS